MDIIPNYIEIDGSSCFLSVDHFELVKEVGCHSTLKVGGCLEFQTNKNFSKHLNWLNKNIDVLFCSDLIPSEAIYVFHGTITDVRLNKSGENLLCSVEAKSLSYRLDLNKKTRFFQNSEKTYRHIFDHILRNYDRVFLREVPFLSQNVEDFIVQNEETDWDFLCRIARRCKTPIFLLDSNEKLEIYSDSKTEPADLVCESLEISATVENETIGLKTDKMLKIGEIIKLDGSFYYVCRAVFKLVNSVVKNFYLLRKNLQADLKAHDSGLTGKLFKAVVTENNDPERLGRVKLCFDGEDVWPSSRYFNFLTPYSSSEGGAGTGFFSMPEKNEKVVVQFADENECYASHVLRDKPDKNLADSSHKIWRNSKGKELRLTDNSISISAKDDKVHIFLDEKKIEILNHGLHISLSEKEAFFKQLKNEIRINSDGIAIKSGKARLTLRKDEVIIKGSKIKLN